MARGRQKAEWDRTALLAAIGANPYRDTAKHPKPYGPWEFNPFGRKPLPAVESASGGKIKVSVQCLKPLCEPRNYPRKP